MSLFKVIAQEKSVMGTVYYVDMPSPEFTDGKAIDLIKAGKAKQIKSTYIKNDGEVKVLYFSPVDIQDVRVEAKVARTILKEQKEIEKAEKKAEKKANFKEKKSK